MCWSFSVKTILLCLTVATRRRDENTPFSFSARRPLKDFIDFLCLDADSHRYADPSISTHNMGCLHIRCASKAIRYDTRCYFKRVLKSWQVCFICHTEPTTEKWIKDKLKSNNRYAQKYRNPTSALGPYGSSFGPSSLAPIDIHHLLLSNLTIVRQ